MGAFGGNRAENENRGELGVGAVTEILGTSPGNATPGVPGIRGVCGVRGVTGVRGAPWDCVRIWPREETEVWCSDAESEEQLALAA